MVAWRRNINNHEGHIPPQPMWLGAIRAVEGVFNILVMSLCANAASYFYLDGYGMSFFTFVWTALFLLYVYLTPHYLPHFYHHWIHLAWEATLAIFWLVTFALLADYVRGWDAADRFFNIGGPMVDSTKAAMTFALLNWLLFCATLAISVWLWRGHEGHTTTVDGMHGSGGGFKMTNPFSKKNRAPDAEKGIGHTGPVTETGQPAGPTIPGATHQ